MRLDDQRESSNIDDERGADTSGIGGAGGGFGGGRMRIGGIGAIAVVLVGMYFGIDPRLILGLLDGSGGSVQTQQSQAPHPQQTAQEDSQRRFVAKVLGSTEDVWTQQFQAMGRTYHPPHLVLFTDVIQSGCGVAQSATGPFYCPADGRVYLDTAFFQELQGRLGAGGDFARAYVIAHEIGHHVQDELGLMQRTDELRQRLDERGRNALSVRVELQADCYAGVWAKQADDAKHILETGDVEQGITAAAAVGDDRLQRMSRGTVSPDSFTHGSSAQRVAWFKRGFAGGAIGACDTFARNADVE
ncbi:hypothetical protein FHR90_002089 [Endobacter medicaginis]|uniref:Neutral zinc metallopeptidase n=1 Tax=Endobacter medicaginis TaxID=1181271 RepID=A0A839V0Q6_9PROT|nr:neutral zinc metallopeptidase [Endobacter medicaginis]MBB3174253.1 hypothetical protein [Endobacter medicaginis]MCX5474297.1 zinc metallopeptidase [Endobacter medicaginis]NVN29063.1 neutral zinc metallopeptidase [Endobacter medicaginis]